MRKRIKLKLALCFMVTILVSSCHSIKIENRPPFNITEATYYSWTGGQPGVSGINIIMTHTPVQEVVFDSVYFRGMKGVIETYTSEKETYIIGRINTSKSMHSIISDGTSQIIESVSDQTENYGLKDNEALILYTFKNKKSYFKVSDLVNTQPKYYK